MGSFFQDMVSLRLSFLSTQLLRNKMITFLSFASLITSTIFIQLHPHSVWYYFLAGFFMCRMLELICEKTQIKYLIKDALDKLEQIKKGLI